ncbi:hypothetical protein ACETK8_14980 [Brevundimonas staleyi]|uniref:MarR family transcriptional regulator n=1 Tax=Brevundimonas staleyi TaxID=74326 RepID=A0ABW0FV21_9CAUL
MSFRFSPTTSPSEIRAHPRFEAAFDAFVDQMADVYAHDNRLRGLGDFKQGVCFQLLVCFDAARDPSNPDTLFTTARVAEAMATMDVHDRRATSELVRRLRDDDYATIETAAHDARVLELRATEKSRRADREWLQVMHEPLLVLDPDEKRFELGARRDPAYQQAFRATALPLLPRAAASMAGNPEADYFVRQTQGGRIMMSLMQSVRGRPDRRTEPGYYAWAAKRCGVSAPHVRKVLQGAADQGWIRLIGGQAVTVEVLPALEEGVRRWTASCLSTINLNSLHAWWLMTGQPVSEENSLDA